MKMIRKQFYIEAVQDAKLKRIAADERCTEAEVVRRAIDELAEREEPEVVRRLREAGLLVEPTEESRMTDEERRRRLKELDEWCLLHGPVGLAAAVIAEREESPW